MEEKEIHNDLAAIRNLMERSQKFISLSGLSGILAGIYALIGAAVAYYIVYVCYPIGASRKALQTDTAITATPDRTILTRLSSGEYDEVLYLLIVAVIVLLASVLTCYFLSKSKAKRKGQAIWGRISQSLAFYMAVPLVSGGALIFILLLHHHYGIVSGASLIFYGLALVSASNFTFTMVKYLGLCEIILGLIAACLPGYGLLFWAIGFGVLHIIYGSMMYLRYDR